MKTGHNENIDYRQRVTSGARPVAAASEPDRRAALHRKELVGVLLLFFWSSGSIDINNNIIIIIAEKGQCWTLRWGRGEAL